MVNVVDPGKRVCTSCVTTLHVICEEEYVVGVVEHTSVLFKPGGVGVLRYWLNEL